MIEPAVAALGYELWGCEWVSMGKNRQQLRVYIDREQGVNIDDCAKISRQISAIFEVEDPIQGHYVLEVSSPGIERSLFTMAHCQRYIGHPVSLRLRAPKEGRRNFSGILKSAADERIILELDDETTLEIAWRDVDKAHLVAKPANRTGGRTKL